MFEIEREFLCCQLSQRGPAHLGLTWGGDRWQGTCSYILAVGIIIWARIAVFSEPQASLSCSPWTAWVGRVLSTVPWDYLKGLRLGGPSGNKGSAVSWAPAHSPGGVQAGTDTSNIQIGWNQPFYQPLVSFGAWPNGTRLPLGREMRLQIIPDLECQGENGLLQQRELNTSPSLVVPSRLSLTAACPSLTYSPSERWG